MDGRGRCLDNIFIERLWRSLKYEAVYLRELADGVEARRVIGEWIDCYNTERPHSALGGKTPAEAYRGDPSVDMMDQPLPPPHRRNNTGKEIDSKGFWQQERQPEYTLTEPPDRPKRRRHLSYQLVSLRHDRFALNENGGSGRLDWTPIIPTSSRLYYNRVLQWCNRSLTARVLGSQRRNCKRRRPA